MRVHRVIADLSVPDLDEAGEFYRGYLGLGTEEFNLGWVARLVSPDSGAHLQLVTEDASAPVNPVASVLVDDAEEAYDEAQRRGYEIVHPLTREEWGTYRFFVRAPDGNVLNVVEHPR